MSNKKVLVAGGAGFIGTNLVKALLEKGYEVKATLHNESPQLDDNRVQYIVADLQQERDCSRAVEGVDWVFMCAANTSGAAVIEKMPLVHVTPNVIMNTLMLQAAYNAGVKKFLFLSSNVVYPPVKVQVSERDAKPGEFFEKYFCAAWMKYFTEIECQMYAEKIQNPMTTLVVRPANVYGPYDNFDLETSHVIPALIRKVVERQSPIEVWGTGQDVKDLIFVEDFVEGVILAMESYDSFEIVNIGTGTGISVEEAVTEITKQAGYSDAKMIFNSNKPSMIPYRVLNVVKAQEELRFNAKTSFKDGVRKTIEWYMNHKN